MDKSSIKLGDVLYGEMKCKDGSLQGWWYGTVVEDMNVKMHETGTLVTIDRFTPTEIVGNVYDNPELAGLYSNHLQVPIEEV